MLYLKIIFLQTYWYLTAYFGRDFPKIFIVLTIGIILINYLLYRPKVGSFNYLKILLFFISFSFLEIKILSYLGLITFQSFPYWLICLYSVFICYYGDIFNYLKDKKNWVLSLMGGVGGTIAYWGGVKISNLDVFIPYYFIGIFFF
jgi:hypothetical protein